jgi:alpha-glucosidase
MNLKKILLALRSLGLKKITPTIEYSYLRDRRDREYRARLALGSSRGPGSLLEALPIHQGARFHFQAAALEVVFLAPDLVRLSWEPGLPPLPYALADQEWPPVGVELAQNTPGWLLSTPQLQVLVKRDGGTGFFQPGPSGQDEGALLRADLPPRFQQSADGEVTSWTLQTQLARDERIYGLGERAARLNRRGGTYTMWNTDPGGSYGPGKDPLYISIPAYLSLHSAGTSLVFYENPFRSVFSIGDPAVHSDQIQASFEDGMLRYYFTAGTVEQVVGRFAGLTGRADLPPRWALGYHQCRWGYKDESDVRQVVRGFRENDLPLSAIHLDIDYMEDYRVFTVDRQRFPDLPGLSRELADQDIRLVTILDPGVKVDPQYAVYAEGVQRRSFVTSPDGTPLVGRVWPGASVYPDFTNPLTREWWAGQYDILLDQGVAGIWHDMNEPTSFTAWGDMTLPLDARHALEGRCGDHRQAHNLYALLMNKTGHAALRFLRPERRPWIITRAGWAGMQRYSWNWTGDTESTWESMRMTIPMVLGLGLCGVPFSGPDIGGFSGNPSPELYLRWFQLASFLPYFRTHSSIGTQPREPWVYGEPYTAILRRFLHLRCRIMPYLYTLAWQAAETGVPMVRPLFWPAASDPRLWEVDDAFLLGDDLLVAPVLEEGAAEREVHLPQGEWYDFWGDRLYEGGSTIRLSTPLQQIPLLVRAGSILPLEELNHLVLHVYPDPAGRASGQLYSDAGDGYGPNRVDHFQVENETLSRQEQGDYPFPYAEVALHVHGSGGTA